MLYTCKFIRIEIQNDGLLFEGEPEEAFEISCIPQKSEDKFWEYKNDIASPAARIYPFSSRL